ncbi:hypothetical protein [uncultured Psychroserpens sp.]|uniref:hypothetical protein n=1 Tax=uncultured Psychroserpens sp. TaxID=255436 RepID=UPI00262B0390|nr:hypothetical protein [uncultured Psychroserpens sp.]
MPRTSSLLEVTMVFVIAIMIAVASFFEARKKDTTESVVQRRFSGVGIAQIKNPHIAVRVFK